MIVAATAGPSAAQPTPSSAAATVQFDKGRALMKQKKYAEACAAFERSQKLEAAPGTLYNLALCYVEIGRLATAWAAFKDLAARDRNKARRRAARRHAKALARRMPRLALALAIDEPPSGLVVKLDGADVTSLIGAETPIDLGPHTIEARAPGFARFSRELELTEEGKRVVVELELEPERDREATGTTAAATTGGSGASAGTGAAVAPIGRVDAPPRSTRKRAGWLVAGGGGLLVIGGVLVGRLAANAWDDAKALCGDDLQCDDAAQLARGNQLVADARLRANISTGMVVAGAIAAGIGAYLVVTAPRREARARQALNVTPAVGPAHAGVLVEGRF